LLILLHQLLIANAQRLYLLLQLDLLLLVKFQRLDDLIEVLAHHLDLHWLFLGVDVGHFDVELLCHAVEEFLSIFLAKKRQQMLHDFIYVFSDMFGDYFFIVAHLLIFKFAEDLLTFEVNLILNY
jgi:hypothetical protein